MAFDDPAEARARLWRLGGLALTLAIAFLLAIVAGHAPPGLPQAALAALSLALLLVAAAVAVPAILRRGVLRRWFPWRTQFRFTAAGLPFLGALLLLVIAAINSGNNLLYLIVATLLGALAASGVFSALDLSGLSLSFEWPELTFAGQPAPIRLGLGNEKRLLPSWSLTLSASSRALGAATLRPVVMRAAYFPYLPRRRHAAAYSEITFPRRGVYSAAAFTLGTRFPFGLIEKRRILEPGWGVNPETELTVFPSISQHRVFAARLAEWSGQRDQPKPGQGDELYRLRAHTAGDSIRFVHWKASAKMGSLRVREYSQPAEGAVRVVLALEAGAASAEQNEQAIEICAALIWQLAQTDLQLEFLGCNSLPEPNRPRHSPRPFGGHWLGSRRLETALGKARGKTTGAPADTATVPVASRPGLRLSLAPAADQVRPILRYLALVDAAAPAAPWLYEGERAHCVFVSRPVTSVPAGRAAIVCAASL